jgi:hypothetical protein
MEQTMTKPTLLLALLGLSLASPLAQAADDTLLYCSTVIGTKAHGTIISAAVTSDGTQTSMHVQRCTGVLNWGCGNGMDNLVNETIDVQNIDSTNFVGSGGLLVRAKTGEYTLTSPELSHRFTAPECGE